MTRALPALLLAGCLRFGPPDAGPGADTGPRADSGVIRDGVPPVEDLPPDLPATDTGETGRADLDPYVEPSDLVITPWNLEDGDTATLLYRGAIAGEASVIAMYGFDGWARVEGVDGLVCIESPMDDVCKAEAEMTAVEGGFTLDVTFPPGTRALHLAFRSADGTAWDDAGGHGYHASVTFPHVGPFLTWDGDEAVPGEGVVVSWETDVPCLGVVEHGPTEALGLTAVGTATDRLHQVAITGLEPGATWYYRVRDSTGQASEVFSYRVPDPEAGAFRFVVMGDMQDTGEDTRWADVAAAVSSLAPDAAFALITGDMPQIDDPGGWWLFFDRGRALLATLPVMPAPGNHDTAGMGSGKDTSSFARWFRLPHPSPDGVFYGFSYGSARFVLLDSQQEPDFAEGTGAQDLFVQDEIAACGTAWACDPLFAAWHRPPYDAGERHFREQGITRLVTRWFEGHVDWVFGGHEHLAQRMVPLRWDGVIAPSGAYGRGKEDGVGYVVVPSAGQVSTDRLAPEGEEGAETLDLLAFPPLPGKGLAVASENGFVDVTVDGGDVTITTWGMGNPGAPVDPWIRDRATSTR